MHNQYEQNNFKNKILLFFSHELKTPLNGAISPLELALQNNNVDANLLTTSLTNLQILENTLNDIIDFTSLMSDQFKLMPRIINPHKVCKYLVSLIKKQCEIKNIKLIYEYDKNIPKFVSVDENRLKQVLYNILSNAIKYTQTGQIIFKATMNEIIGQIEFTIKDSGIGMTKKKLRQLQSMFRDPTLFNAMKIDQSRSLGLLISQQIILQLNKLSRGLKVTSELDKGSEFKFSIEIREPPESTESISSFQLVQELVGEEQINSSEKYVLNLNHLMSKTKTILIVDDDSFNQLVLETILKSFGLASLKAFNGKDAVNQLNDNYSSINKEIVNFNFIFMDYQMPILNGIEATKILKQLMTEKKIPKIPIIACTAYGSATEIENCLASGMDDFIIKPVNLSKIKDLLTKWKIIGTSPN